MNAGARRVKVLAHKGRHRRNVIAQVRLIVTRDLCDVLGLHAIESATQRCVLKDHGLQWRVARALAKAKERAVGGGDAIEPCGAGVGDGLAKVVVAVPLEQIARKASVVPEAVGDARNAAR